MSYISLPGVNLSGPVIGVLPIANGGTNNTSFSTYGIVYYNPSSLSLTNDSSFIFDPTVNRVALGINSITAGGQLRIYQTGVTAPTDVSTFSNVEVNSGEGNYASGRSVNYKIFTYKYINGLIRYSTNPDQTGLTTVYTDGTVMLSWSAVSGVDGYKVYRELDGTGLYTHSVDALTSTGFNDDIFISWVSDNIGSGQPTSLATFDFLYNYYPISGGSSCYSVYGGSGYFSSNLGVGTIDPTARIHIGAGTTAAGTAPIKFTTGPYTTTPVSGQLEWYSSSAENLTFSPSSTRYRIPLIDSGVGGLTSTRVPFSTTNGRLTDDADLTFNSSTNELSSTNFSGQEYRVYNSSNTSETTEIFVATDELNGAVRATYITPINFPNNRRLFFGTSTQTFFSVCFKNVSLFEGVNAMAATRYSLPNAGTPFFNLMGAGSGQSSNINTYYSIIIRPTWNSNPSTTYSAFGATLTEYGVAVVGQIAGAKQFAVVAHASQSGNLISIEDSSRTALSVFNPSGYLHIGGSSPTAYLHIKAGTSTANTSPLKLTSGTLNTTPEAGALEYNGNFYNSKVSNVRFGVGGSLFDYFADANNGTTVETDLYSSTLAASTLAANGDCVKSVYSGTFVNSTSTKQIKVYFGGTAIFDSGALTVSAATDWVIHAYVIRESSTAVRCAVMANLTGASTANFAKYTGVTGLTLSNTQVLKITGTAAGVGAASNDITAKFGFVEFKANA